MINLGQQDVKLQEEIVLGHYQKALSEEIMITQEDIFGVNVGEPWTPGEVEQEVLKGNGKGLSTSPMDIDPREPIQLRDAEVTLKHRKAFEDLCSEFETIFSRDSADLRKTPLLKMDIPTGDSPPITQRPYTLALKHVEWVQDEIEILEKAGIIAKSVSPWASPIVIVPKKTAPGEPPPTDLTETGKFLGFVGYYRKFIPKYSDIARPLTNLTRKDILFEWSKACQAAFEMLKEYLLKEPYIKISKT